MRRGPLAVRCKVGIGAGPNPGRAHYIPAGITAELVDSKVRYIAHRWLCTATTPKHIVLLPPDHGREMCVHCLDHLRPTVYRCFSTDGSLVYIGSSIQRTRRLRVHQNSEWWPLVAEVRFEEFPTGADAYRAEQDAIRREHPSANRTPAGFQQAAMP